MAGGYKSYKGGHRKRRPGVLVLVLFLLTGALIFFYALQNLLLQTREPSSLSNPTAVPSATVSQPPSPSIQISPSTTPTTTPTPSPSPAPTSKTDLVLRAVYLPDIQDEIALAGAEQLYDNGTINALVIDMKHDDGTLGYFSNTSIALRSGGNPDYNPISLIQTLKERGIYLVARISAFKDDLVPRRIQTSSVKTESGVIWLDRNYHGWLNPYNSEAREYIRTICTELAEIGFDEILLSNLVFPTIGRPQLIYYGSDATRSKPDTLNTLLREIKQDLAPTDTLLSVKVEDNALYTANEASGQDGPNLYTLTDRIYVTITKDTDTAALYTQYPSTTKLIPGLFPPTPYTDPNASLQIQLTLSTYTTKDSSYLIQDDTGLYPSEGW